MSIADIINVTEANFEDEVLMYSDRVLLSLIFGPNGANRVKRSALYLKNG
jgi:thioredoxin-like negative regulator of GroEL